MGYTVLYIAFGVVALWLLGEVLLQYKARLRWRLLAFAGFLGVVAGVMLPQVFVIILGAAAFGTGQTLVTLSYRRGFSTGWSIGGRPGSSRRRKAAAEPVLEVSDVEYAEADPYADQPGYADDRSEVLTGAGDPAAESTPPFGAGFGQDPEYAPVYSTSPLPEDTGEYGIYSDRSSYVSDPYTSGGFEGYGAQGYGSEWQEEPQPATAYAYDTFAAGTAADDDVFAAGATGLHSGQGTATSGYDQQAYQQQSYQQQPYQSYDSYGTYDPYAAQQSGAPGAYDSYGQYPPQQDYAGYQPQYPQDPYQAQPQQPYGYDTPAPDAWAADQYGQQPNIPQQPAQPPYAQPQPGDPYDPQQQRETYQPYGY